LREENFDEDAKEVERNDKKRVMRRRAIILCVLILI